MFSDHKYNLPNAHPSPKRHLPVALLAVAAALVAPVFLTSAATAGNGGLSSGGTGGAGTGTGGDGDGGAFLFPIPAKHYYGDGFGAGRGHQGQDVFARCGKDLVAVRDGRVQTRGYHSSAGNYIVIDIKGSGLDFAYMHLKRKAIPREGSRVRRGQKLGAVGATGNASGCHLHFEKWGSPGYYEGGAPKASVTKSLKKWDRTS